MENDASVMSLLHLGISSSLLPLATFFDSGEFGVGFGGKILCRSFCFGLSREKKSSFCLLCKRRYGRSRR